MWQQKNNKQKRKGKKVPKSKFKANSRGKKQKIVIGYIFHCNCEWSQFTKESRLEEKNCYKFN